MRMLLRVKLDVEAGNAAIKNNRLHELMQSKLRELKPEAAYFFADHGTRTANIFFDLKDTALMPSIAEPFFQTLNATVEFIPVMNAEDLRAGLDQVKENQTA